MHVLCSLHQAKTKGLTMLDIYTIYIYRIFWFCQDWMSVSSCQWERLHHQHWKEEMRSPPPHQPCRSQALLENVLQHHACLGISSHLCNSLARQFKGHITNSVKIWHNLQVLTGMHHEGSTGTQTLYIHVHNTISGAQCGDTVLATNPLVGSCWTLLDLLATSHRSWQLFSFSPSEDLVLLTSSVANPWSSTSKRSESKNNLIAWWPRALWIGQGTNHCTSPWLSLWPLDLAVAVRICLQSFSPIGQHFTAQLSPKRSMAAMNWH